MLILIRTHTSTSSPLVLYSVRCVRVHLRSHCPSYRHPRPHPICSYPSVSNNTQPVLVFDLRNTTWLGRILAHCLPYVHITAPDKHSYVVVRK